MKGIVVLGTAGERAWQAAAVARRTGARDRAFSRLVRAHIRNQHITRLQLRCHLAMLRVGRLQRDAREIVGQFPRDFAALLFSRIGGGGQRKRRCVSTDTCPRRSERRPAQRAH